MLDLSWGEIAVILVVAVVVIGPKELPAVLRTCGRMLAKAKKVTDEIKKSFNEALAEDEISATRDKMKKELRQIVDMDGNLQDAYDVSELPLKRTEQIKQRPGTD